MASGASGAELANIINEGALRAVRSNRTFVTEADLEESVEVVIAGYQKKNAVLSDKEKKRLHIMRSDMHWWLRCRAILHRYRRLRLSHVHPVRSDTQCRWSRPTNI